MIARLALLVFSFSALSIAAAATGEGETVLVRPVVEISGGREKTDITLGDLIVAHGLSATALERLKEAYLADMPVPGEPRSFSSGALQETFRPILRELEVESGEHIEVRLPARVIVTRKSFRLSHDDIDRELRARFTDFCRDCQFEITNLQLPVLPTSVPEGSSWSVRLNHELPHGGFSLPLEVVNEDASKRTYWISGTVAISKKVPVAARAIANGEHVRDEDYLLESRDVTYANDIPPSATEFKTSVTARAIAAGQIIWRANLRREMVVKSGDVVKVVSGNDEWSVMIDGISQSSGYIGDTINVKIPRTQKQVSGLLKEKGVVEVH